MRKASQNYGFIVIDNKFVGISLGYDFCAEHEWGIEELKKICGIPDATKKNMGVTNRTITKCPLLAFQETEHENKKFAILYSGSLWNNQEDLEKYIPRDLDNYMDDLIWNEKWTKEHPTRENKDNITTAWDGSSFGIAVMGETEINYLKEIYNALQSKNITIAVFNYRQNNPFAGEALSLLITDRIPQEYIDNMYKADKEYFDRLDYEEKIGMVKVIKKYGNKNGYGGDKYFCACTPRWIDYENSENREEIKKRMNTKYDIQYWINYSDSDNNFGYYTVEEIREWLTGTKKLTEIRKG